VTAEIVANLLAAHGVAADLLEPEVTESALMTGPLRAQRLPEELSALGVQISIDDFGAGYTSRSELKTLPVNELEIKKPFVMTMSEDTSNEGNGAQSVHVGHNGSLVFAQPGALPADALEQVITAER